MTSSSTQARLSRRATGAKLVASLGVMAGQVVSALLTRVSRDGRHRLDASGLLTQFRHDAVGFVPRSTAVAVDERPPMETVPEYRSRSAGLVG